MSLEEDIYEVLQLWQDALRELNELEGIIAEKKPGILLKASLGMDIVVDGQKMTVKTRNSSERDALINLLTDNALVKCSQLKNNITFYQSKLSGLRQIAFSEYQKNKAQEEEAKL